MFKRPERGGSCRAFFEKVAFMLSWVVEISTAGVVEGTPVTGIHTASRKKRGEGFPRA